MRRNRQTAVGVVMVAALAAAAAWALWPGGTTPAVAGSPYTTAIDCLRYNQRTGRVPIRLTVTNTTARPLRFRGHVDITIARVRPGSADHVRFARIAAVSPLTTIRPGGTFRWATRSRPAAARRLRPPEGRRLHVLPRPAARLGVTRV